MKKILQKNKNPKESGGILAGMKNRVLEMDIPMQQPRFRYGWNAALGLHKWQYQPCFAHTADPNQHSAALYCYNWLVCGLMELHVHWFFHGGESIGMLEAFFCVHIGLCYVGCIHYSLLCSIYPLMEDDVEKHKTNRNIT